MAESFYRVNPSGTYLVTASWDRPAAPTALNLAALGATAGEWLSLRMTGLWSWGIGTPQDANSLVAVFVNASGGFLASVGGNGVVTMPPYQTNLVTDIAQDFSIGASASLVQVPVGAVAIWFGTNDSAFWDNTDPDGDFGVWIEKRVVDRTPPRIDFQSPGHGSTAVPTDSDVFVRFDEDIVRGGGALLLRDEAGALLETLSAGSDRVSQNGRSLTINPFTELVTGKTYRIEFTSGFVIDTAGNAFTGSAATSFRTGGPNLGVLSASVLDRNDQTHDDWSQVGNTWVFNGSFQLGHSAGVAAVKVRNAHAVLSGGTLSISGDFDEILGAQSRALFSGNVSLNVGSGSGAVTPSATSLKLAGVSLTAQTLAFEPGIVSVGAGLQPVAGDISLPALSLPAIRIAAAGIATHASIGIPPGAEAKWLLFNTFQLSSEAGLQLSYSPLSDQINLIGDLTAKPNWQMWSAEKWESVTGGGKTVNKLDIIPTVTLELPAPGLVIRNGTVDVNGKLSLKDFTLVGMFNVESMSLAIDTLENKLSGAFKLGIGGSRVGIDATLELQWTDPYINLNSLQFKSITLAATLSPGIPLFGTPVWLTRIGAGISNFDSAKDVHPSITGLFGFDIFTAALHLEGQATWGNGERIEGKLSGHLGLNTDIALVKFDMETTIDLGHGFTLKGTVEVPLGLSKTHVPIWAKPYFSWLPSEPLKISAAASADFDKRSLVLGAEVLKFPGLSELSGGVSVRWVFDDNDSNDVIEAWAAMSFRGVKIGAGVKINPHTGAAEFVGLDAITKIGSWQATPQMQALLVTASWDHPSIVRPQTRVVVYDDAAHSHVLARYEEADYAANNIEVITRLGADTHLVLGIAHPNAGVWDVELVNPQGLGTVIFSAIAPGESGSLALQALHQAGPLVQIDFSSAYAPANPGIDFFIDTDSSGYDGVLVGSITDADGAASFTWNSARHSAGTYWIYAQMNPADGVPVRSYLATPMAIAPQPAALPGASLADDLVIGSATAEVFEAGLGDDTLVSVGGADTVEGGPGNDLLVLPGRASGYTHKLVTTALQSFTDIDPGDGQQGTLFLSNIERVLFSADAQATVFVETSEDNAQPAGRLIAEALLLRWAASPAAPAPAGGIALTSAEAGHGQWQYRLDGAAPWAQLAGLAWAPGQALLLPATAQLRLLPAADFNGLLSLGYRLWDESSGTAGSVVAVTPGAGGISAALLSAQARVSAVNDPPVATNTAPSLAEDHAQSATLVASDVDGDSLSYEIVSPPAHGSVTLGSDGHFSYLPHADYNGPDSFTWRSHDGMLASAPVSVTLHITAVDDAPRLARALPDVFATTGQAFSWSVPAETFFDADGQPLSLSVVLENGGPLPGWLQFNAASHLFSGHPGNAELGTLALRISASDGASSSSDVMLLHVAVPNRAPMAADASLAGSEDQVLSGQLPVASDADGDTVVYAKASDPAHGSLSVSASGAFSYTPAANFFGADRFEFQVSDGRGGSSRHAVQITLTEINDAPVASAGSASTAEDSVLLARLPVASDIEGHSVAYSLFTAPAHGSVLVQANGDYRYTPRADYHGPDGFVFALDDGHGGSNRYPISLVVSAVNDVPSASDGQADAVEDVPLSARLPAASDVEGHSLSYALASPAAHGTVVVDAAGGFVYTPQAHFNGADSFGFSVTDAQGGSSRYLMRVQLAAMNDAPQGTLAIEGDMSLFETLQARLALSDVDGLGPVNHQWLRNGAPIAGASASSYTLSAVDIEARISLRVSYTDGGGTAESVLSSATGPVLGFTLRTGTAGEDTLNGGSSLDLMLGLDGADRLFGLAGRDSLDGGAGNDTLFGNDGDDTLLGSEGNDVLLGGSGSNELRGGAGFNIASYAGLVPVNANLATGWASANGLDVLLGIQGLVGSAAADTLTGRNGADIALGETFRPGGGNDSVDGGGGIDTVEYAGRHSNYSVVRGAGSGELSVSHRAGGADGIDTLRGIERLLFQDGLWAFDARAQEVARIAFALWGPGVASDAALLAIGISHHDGGLSYAQLAGLALGTFGDISNTDLALKLLANVPGSSQSLASLGQLMQQAGGGGRLQAVQLMADDAANLAQLDLAGLRERGIPVALVANGSTLFGPMVAPARDMILADDSSVSLVEDSPWAGRLPMALDIDGDSLVYSLASAAAHGSAVVDADGSYRYTPAAHYAGMDSFSYSASDGQGTRSTRTVTLTVTDQVDAFTGTAGADAMPGHAGADHYSAGAGSDFVATGGGNDSVDGGAGIDRVGFAGPRAQYTVTRASLQSDALAVQHLQAGGDGSDSLTGVERLIFQDRLLAFGSRADELAKVAFALWSGNVASDSALFAVGLKYYDGASAPSYSQLIDAALGYWTNSNAALAAQLVANVPGSTHSVAELLSLMNADAAGGRAKATLLMADDPANLLQIELMGLRSNGLVADLSIDGVVVFGPWPGP